MMSVQTLQTLAAIKDEDDKTKFIDYKKKKVKKDRGQGNC